MVVWDVQWMRRSLAREHADGRVTLAQVWVEEYPHLADWVGANCTRINDDEWLVPGEELARA